MRFSMLSGNEIRKYAETQVWTNRIYGPDTKPVPNGLLDTRMVIPRFLSSPLHILIQGFISVSA
jgi:DNA-directed RNA polymerase beta' subunit